MLKTKKKIEELPYQKLITEVQKTWKYGKVYPHQKIAKVIGIPYHLNAFNPLTGEEKKVPNSEYGRTIAKANQKLIRMGLAITIIKGKGYELMKHGYYAVEAVNKIHAVERKIRFAQALIENADPNKMKDTDRNYYNKVKEKLAPMTKTMLVNAQKIKEIVYDNEIREGMEM